MVWEFWLGSFGLGAADWSLYGVAGVWVGSFGLRVVGLGALG